MASQLRFFARGCFWTEIEIVEPSEFTAGSSRDPSDGNGRPFARPDAFSASYNVTEHKLAEGMFGSRCSQ
jgi:hypothetical protein